ncbi:UDP-N-acetylmuramoyl-tripeptide--D-alanyl-D-alanine ligase [Aminobacterium mobile]|uniref:UDP-N-acetylmuramoyl-tripeptide--D-alanyl-D- alanine ligase n=1 Tax=Aminobacterium mobile TaxID=81467 RepID=UPI0033151485
MKWQLWKISDLAGSIGATWSGSDIVIPDFFCVDSREVYPGSAFVAVRGANQDGHDYIIDALHRGATLIIAEKGRVPKGISFDGRAYIEVNDSVTDMARMASAYLKAVAPQEVVAITGSVGKTTTREIIKKCLERFPFAYGAERSFNTLIGCSLTILGMSSGTEVLILEMGTNKPGEIAEMVQYFPPTRAIITEVSSAHLEGLKSLEGVIAAKLEILQSSDIKTIFFNEDNRLLTQEILQHPGEYEKVGVGYIHGLYRIKEADFHIIDGLPRLKTVLLTPDGGAHEIYTGLWGTHASLSIAFALALCSELHFSLEEAIHGLETMSALPGRGVVMVLKNEAILIDDSYNANPSSMDASLTTLLDLPATGRKIAVLGSMKELGEDDTRLHEEVLKKALALDVLFLIGEEWKDPYLKLSDEERKRVACIADLKALGAGLLSRLHKGDLLLVKGSHIHRLDLVVSSLVGGNKNE